MRKKLLAALAFIGLLAMITIPFTSPVMAADTLTSITTSSYPQLADVPSFITSSGISTTYFGVTFTGSFASLPTNTDIKAYSGGVQDLTITFNVIGWVVPNISFNADIIVGASAHGPRDVTVLASNTLYSGIIVGEFPYPVGNAGSQVGISITPYSDVSGSPGSPITHPVSDGTIIWYRITINQSDSTKLDFIGGQLSVRFPSHLGNRPYIHVAGYGAVGAGSTPAAPDIPEVKPPSPANDFSVFAPQSYTVSSADLDASGFLIAEADYGKTNDLPAQINGVVEGEAPTDASGTITNSLLMYGNLRVTKIVDIPSAVLHSGLNKTFTVTVTGPSSYSNPLTFTVTDGVLVTPATGYYDLTNLTPGTYHVAESPGTPWNVSITGSSGNVLVSSGSSVSSNVTNTFVPGCLTITKSLSIPGGVPLSALNGNFTIHVAGPNSFSQDLTFTMTSGVISGAQTINNLVPGTYTTSEPSPPANWTPTGMGTVTVDSGETCATQTVTNTYVPGCLTITKSLSIPGGVPLSALNGNFTIHVAGPNSFSQDLTFTMTSGVISGAQTINNLIPGTYTTSEPSPPANWTPTGMGTVTVNSGQTCATQTVTNTYVPGCLTITKSLSIPGGVPLSALNGNFTIHVAGPSSFSQDLTFTMTSGVISGAQTINNLIPGTYTTSEPSPPANWTPTGMGTVTVNSGQTCATQTVTNTYVPGCLTITKSLSIPGGVPLSALNGNFTIHVTGPNSFSQDLTFTMTSGVISGAQTINNLVPGTYTTSEPSPPANWTPTGMGTVTVVTDGSCATQTVTNTFVPGCLTITKSLSIPGGVPLSALNGNFTIHVTGPSSFSQDLTFTMTSGVISGAQTINNLIPGTYTTSEPSPPANWTPTGMGAVTVSSGATCATQTVTNTYVPGCLTITKSLSIPQGVPLSSLNGNFTIHLTGPSSFSQDLTFTMTSGVISGAQTINNLIPGTYTTSEPSPPANWTPTGMGTVTVNSGQTCATQTVTNTYVPGCLTITKSLSIPGGVPLSALNGNFTIHVTGPNSFSQDLTFTMTSGVISGAQTINNLVPGTYTTSEPSPPANWTPTGMGTVTVVTDGSCATQTVTNTFVPGCLTITKSLSIPGGVPLSALNGNFTIHVTGPSSFSQDLTFTMTSGVISGAQTINNLVPGTYTTSEPSPPSNWTPTGMGAVTVNSGATCATQTVTNTYVPGCLTITKSLSIPQGVPLSSLNGNFTIHVTGPNSFSQDLTFTMTSGVISGAQTINNLVPGTYTTSEPSPPANWTPTGMGAVTVNSGATCATQTVTNTYVPGCLTITKSLSIPQGVPLSALNGNFTIHVTGPNSFSQDLTFTMTSGLISGAQTINNLVPGTYTTSEPSPPANWTPTGMGTVTVVTDGSCATTTVTNTFVPGCLTITKSLSIPQGVPLSALNGNFTIHVTGPSSFSQDLTFTMTSGVISGAQTINNLVPGTYTTSEPSPPANWTPTGMGAVTVNSGATCATQTVTNTYVPGCLTITKSLSIPQGVPLSALNGNFTIHVTGPNSFSQDLTFTMTSGVISGAQTINNLVPGTYTTSEPSPPANWTPTGMGAVTVNSGATCATQTVTNTYVPGCLTITKSLSIPQGVPLSSLNGNFTIHVTGPNSFSQDLTFTMTSGVISGAQTINNLVPGTYTTSEPSPPSNWTPTGMGAVTVNSGATCATQTVTNTYVPGCLTVTKSLSIPNGIPLVSLNGTFTIHVTGPNSFGQDLTFTMTSGLISGAQTINNLVPGTYTTSEPSPPANWTPTGMGTVTVVTDGSCATTTVTNTFVPGSLTVTKAVAWNNISGSGVNKTFTVNVTGPAPSNAVVATFTFTITNGNLQAPTSQTVNNLIPGTYTVTEVSPGTSWSASGGGGVTVNSGATATSIITNTYVYPHTTSSMTVSTNGTLPPGGGNVTITITDRNDGNVPLYKSHIHFQISPLPGSLNAPLGLDSEPNFYFLGSLLNPAPYNVLEIPGATEVESVSQDGVMQPGEFWTWTFVVHITQSTTFTAIGNGFDPNGGYVNYPDVPTEYATGRSNVPPPVPASSDLSLGLMIVGLAGPMLYLIGRRVKRQAQIR